MSVDMMRVATATVPYRLLGRESTPYYEVWGGGTGSQIGEAVAAGTAFLAQPRLAERDLRRLPREELIRIARSAFGMWAGRDDIGDAVAYVRKLRAGWRHAPED